MSSILYSLIRVFVFFSNKKAPGSKFASKTPGATLLFIRVRKRLRNKIYFIQYKRFPLWASNGRRLVPPPPKSSARSGHRNTNTPPTPPLEGQKAPFTSRNHRLDVVVTGVTKLLHKRVRPLSVTTMRSGVTLLSRKREMLWLLNGLSSQQFYIFQNLFYWVLGFGVSTVGCLNTRLSPSIWSFKKAL